MPSMIVEAATKAGMKVPEKPDLYAWDPVEYPHFQVFCSAQLCRPIQWGKHWENAKIIAAISADKICSTTFEDLRELGAYP